ncbi:MAG TPA: hypothetical protein VHR86_10530, partial [Armatimonadota bacterium]|nr:hypothetical protein [Armatimonadota bacterium]
GSLGARTTDVAERLSLSAATRYVAVASMRKDPILKLIVQIGKVLGNRVTRKMILNALPVVSAGVSGGLSWGWANQMGRSAKREFRAFREDLRQGKYLGDPDFDGLVGQECHYDVEQRV